eukprot:COSAG03_NODE_1124_length_4767_cov_15.100257_2_plen_169_part_00
MCSLSFQSNSPAGSHSRDCENDCMRDLSGESELKFVQHSGGVVATGRLRTIPTERTRHWICGSFFFDRQQLFLWKLNRLRGHCTRYQIVFKKKGAKFGVPWMYSEYSSTVLVRYSRAVYESAALAGRWARAAALAAGAWARPACSRVSGAKSDTARSCKSVAASERMD